MSSSDEGAALRTEKELTEALEGANVKLVDVTEKFPPPPRDETGLKTAAEAKQAYDDLDYDGAAAKWAEVLDFYGKHPEAADAKSLADAHFFTAVLALQTGGKSQNKKAQEEFARALVLLPELTCDPNVYGNDVKKIFDKALADVNGRPTAKLSIESSPPGAQITLRGKKLGATPYSEGATVPLGRHFVELSKPGYAMAAVAVDVGKEGASARGELKAAPGYEEVRDGASSAVDKGVGKKGALPANAHKLAEVVKARFLVMSDGTTAEAWDVETGNRLTGLSLSAEELPVTGKKIADFIASPGAVAAVGAGPAASVSASSGDGLLTKWWFWAAVGGVVAVGAVTTVGVVAANNSGPKPFNVVLGTP